MADGGPDVVVVGAGLGGLVAAAKLARAGRSVLVLEQHTVPGGCATTFHRRDFEFEVSLHELDGMDDRDPKREVLADLDVLDALDLEPIPEFYRYRSGDRDIVVPHGRDAIRERLAAAFPGDADGIRRFFDVVLEMRSALTDRDLGAAGAPSALAKAAFAVRNPTFARHRNTTVGDLLDDLVDGAAAKRVLTANLGYYHDDPYSLSLPFYAVAQGGYVAGGGYYVRGGSQALADALVGVVEANGGTVETGRRVTRILAEDGAAAGVRHEASREGTTGTTGDERTEPADAVAVNAAIPLAADDLLPAPHGDRLAGQFEGWERAPSLTTLYLGLDAPPGASGCEHYSTVLQHPDVSALADVAAAQRGSFGRRTLSFVDYGQVAADLAPPGQSVAAVSTVDYLDEWTGLADDEYRAKKRRVADVLLRRVDDCYPGVADAVEHAELATPRTIRRYTLNPGGTAYGFAQTPAQSLFARRVDPPLDALAFASAWTFPGGGFSGAMVSGYRAACRLLDGAV